MQIWVKISKPSSSDLVENGRYNSKSEVLREGVRLVQEREAELAELNASLDRGIADIEAGRTRPAEEVFAELKAKYQAMVVADEQAPRRRIR